MPDVQPTTVSSKSPRSYEDAHVHAIYDQIAPHFSSTRYKPWPIIATFLASLSTGWIGVDLGTGNGKYLPLPADRPGSVWTIGLDRSVNLLKIAKRAGDVDREVVWADVLDNPWRPGAFDYAISIATIHHLASPVRRKIAVQRLLEAIAPVHGRGLIYVWAIEQDELSKRSIPTRPSQDGSQSGTFALTGKGRDVFVPWVLSQPTEPKPKTGKQCKKTQATSPEDSESPVVVPETPPQVFNRYYHMFSQGELTELVMEAALDMRLVVGQPPEMDTPGMKIRGLEIVQDGWERSNYYVELRRWEQ
ncbi:S-adenosyl-L-methionine-dependent methyltransferase [Ganoderma leucocontextum]|nr:S-adenosyl-L-methionine-dependent methyltransferase [Ganoderma leucocontextum]